MPAISAEPLLAARQDCTWHWRVRCVRPSTWTELVLLLGWEGSARPNELPAECFSACTETPEQAQLKQCCAAWLESHDYTLDNTLRHTGCSTTLEFGDGTAAGVRGRLRPTGGLPGVLGRSPSAGSTQRRGQDGIR